jgi:hypothetical protein
MLRFVMAKTVSFDPTRAAQSNNGCIPSLEERLSEANQRGVDFLLTELDSALTFMDISKTSNSVQTVERNHRHACEAYQVVLRYLPKLKLEKAQRLAIDEKLALVKERLRAARIHC